MASLYISQVPPSPGEKKTVDFKPRAYQQELYEHAKKQNSILVLGTGSGKTFISILLIKELGHQIRKTLKENRKWTVFLVNTVPLVYQQGYAIQQHTAFSVGMFERSVGIDIWTKVEWKEEIHKHEVLVIVAQIFLDLLLHSQLSLADINLLILDECHHATGNHPMREVMRIYMTMKAQKPDLCPRVMGLTACVLHKKCKIEDVRHQIRELEKTMSSALTTSSDQKDVKRHTTAPDEVVISFPPSELSEHTKNIQAQFVVIKSEIDEMPNMDDKQKKVLKKKIDNIDDIIVHLGEWCGARAIKYEMENFEEAEDFEEVPALRDFKRQLCRRLELIYQYCCQEEVKFSNPLNHVSKKVQRLSEVLLACKKDVCGLIFVEKRNTAKLLYELLLKVAEVSKDYAFIKPAYVISANSRTSLDINLLQNELKKQKETLMGFARGNSNFLVSTSVLEEGVDVRKCNVVIRFDKPMNFRAYVQSRGRARAVPAKYVLMVEKNSMNELLSSVVLYREIEAVLTEMCHNRELPTDLETRSHFAEDEILPPYEPYGPGGPKITFNSAASLINVYCGKLPQDKFTELVPEFEYKTSVENEEHQIICGIKLPINSCLKETVYGKWMNNREHAKKSAAMALCKRLHEMNELDDRLRPAEKSDRNILDGLVEQELEESTASGTPQPGTRKRRQIYNSEMCAAFSATSGNFKLYSVTVKSVTSSSYHVAVDSERQNVSVGLLCKETLRLPPLSFYSSKWNQVVVGIKLIDNFLQLDSKIMKHIEHFHKIVFETLLGISPDMFDYFPQNTSLLILPMRGGQIDTSLLSDVASRDSLRVHDTVTRPGDVFMFERSAYEDSIIYPLYLGPSEPMYYVTEILDHMNPQDRFPETSRYYESYEDYFLVKYGRKISNRHQPLLTAKHLPRDLNNIKKIATRQTLKRTKNDPPKFVPELCGVLCLEASLWWQVMLVPSVLHRINSLLVAERLTNMMTSPHSYVASAGHCIDIKDFDFDWSSKLIKKLVQPTGNNLSVIIASAKPKPIQPFMILNALTLQGAGDNFNMERLEVLGDSFLKYVVAEFLFLKFPLDHEGILSQRRSKIVSNKTLYMLGKAKHIPEKIQSIILNPKVNGILPGFVLKSEVGLRLQKLDAPHDLWTRFSDLTMKEFEEEMEKIDSGGKLCYNPWTQHELGDKSVADCIEALVGVCLLLGGREAAVTFLSNLGIGIVDDTSMKTDLPVPSAVLCKEEWADTEMQRYYDKYHLDKLENKIQYRFRDRSFLVQAVTHSSYNCNKITDCYQRLEFLGDAILDYLVTGIVFSRTTDYTPGQVSDLRSYYVKNETLARAAARLSLHHHLMYMAPKLQTTIDKYLNLFKSGLNDDEDIFTEDDVMHCEDVEVPKALGDLIEALIGAVYLDSGKSLQKAWDVVLVLMGDIIEQTLSTKNIPINCVRKLYEKVPSGVVFTKVHLDDCNSRATYELQIPGLPILKRSGKNYSVAKIVAAKAGLRMLRENEESEAEGTANIGI